ncbi:formate dehydrogenase [Ideonella sp.]|uniref:formate dehydrogenase n=1 Tax=Ideonella sp. TaxID=1929293 RepID=UPI0035AD9D5D
MSDQPSSPGLSRRRLFAGAGTVGALAAAAAALPLVREPEPQPAAEPAQPEPATGYRLTAHIQRYYQTAKV